MFKRIFQYVFLAVLAAVIAMLQFSLVSGLAFPWNNLNLVFLAIIFTFLVFGTYQTFFLTVLMAGFLDIWSFYHFGLFLVSLLFSAVIVYLILDNVLTNRSLYSFLLLTAIGLFAEALFYHIFLAFGNWSAAAERFFLADASFWQAIFWSLLINLLILALFFNLLALVSRRLQPFFLKKR